MTKEERASRAKIAHNIRKMREIRGYDQDHVADQLGVKQNTYSKIENGETKLSVERLEKLAKVFDTTVENIKYADIERQVFTSNHYNQQGGNAGNITINNNGLSVDEVIQQMLEKMIKPLMDRLETIETRLNKLEK